MPYQMPNNIDPNKIFLVNFSELEGRWDPYYHIPYYSSQRTNYIAKKFIPISQIMLDWNRGDGPREGFYTDDKDNGIYFIRINNLRNHTVILDDIKYINRIIHETKLKRAQVTSGDLVFAISGTKDNLGTVAIIPDNIKEANLNSAIVKLQIDESVINKRYFCYLFDLDLVRQQIEYIGKGAAQNNLNRDEVGQILIPNNPKPFQELVVEILENAQKNMRQKLCESKKKLASIDQYLLSELGIIMPEKNSSLEKRIFTVQFSEVCGRRLDPFWQNVQHEKMTSKKYQEFSVKSLATLQKGTSITSDEIVEGEYPVIAGGQTSPYSHNEYNFEGNVITISASGAYSGYVWYHEQPIFASDCTVLWSIDENKCLTIYIFEILRLKQQELYNLQQGAGQPHVYPQDIAKVLIPLPPLDKQREIVDNIAAIRAEAKRLEQEGEEILQSARQQVEQMILGE